jgi:hypothetical protein
MIYSFTNYFTNELIELGFPAINLLFYFKYNDKF